MSAETKAKAPKAKKEPETRHIARAAFDPQTLLNLLDFDGGTITDAEFDVSLNSLVLTIEHPELPESPVEDPASVLVIYEHNPRIFRRTGMKRV